MEERWISRYRKRFTRQEITIQFIKTCFHFLIERIWNLISYLQNIIVPKEGSQVYGGLTISVLGCEVPVATLQELFDHNHISLGSGPVEEVLDSVQPDRHRAKLPRHKGPEFVL